MKFQDIIEDRRRDAEPYTDVQLDIINRANKWTNRTDFRLNDPEGFEGMITQGLSKTLGREWGKIPKSPDEIIRISQNYKHDRDLKDNDRKIWDLLRSDKNLFKKVSDFWTSKHYGNRSQDFIQASEKRYKMVDPNRPGHLIPRFNYDKFKELGIDFSNTKAQKIPANSLFCNLHKIHFPENPVSINHHLGSGMPLSYERSGCPECAKDSQILNGKLNKPAFDKEQWIEKFKENSANRYPSVSKYSDKLKYDYSESWITNDEIKSGDRIRTKARIHNIRCKIHNYIFANNEQGVLCTSHAAGQTGCPKCNGSESIGEDRMNGILVNIYGESNVKKQEKNISGLTFKGGQLRFDRYVNIDGKEIYFEFDGGQHFKMSTNFHKDMIGYYESVARDTIKNNYCKRNNIKLIRIGYKDSNNMENEIKSALENPSQMVLSTNYPELGWNTSDMKNNNPELYRYLKQFKVIGESDLKLMNLI